MHTSVRTGDSLLASLCREIDRIRQRGRQLQSCMRRCQDPGLFTRLRLELEQLQRRRQTVADCACAWRNQGVGDPLAVAFLVELCRRPLA